MFQKNSEAFKKKTIKQIFFPETKTFIYLLFF